MWKIRCLNSRNVVAVNDDDKLLVISFFVFPSCLMYVYVYLSVPDVWNDSIINYVCVEWWSWWWYCLIVFMVFMREKNNVLPMITIKYKFSLNNFVYLIVLEICECYIKPSLLVYQWCVDLNSTPLIIYPFWDLETFAPNNQTNEFGIRISLKMLSLLAVFPVSKI